MKIWSIKKTFIRSGVTALMLGVMNFLYSAECIVAFEETQQHMSGFGGSTAWAGGLDDDLIDELFSPTDGCGLTLVRMRIAPNGTTGRGEIDIAKKAQALGASIWAAPWSPPAEWKDNNSVNNGGSLLPEHYQDWADRLVSYVEDLKAQGVDLRWISAQNEPNWTAEYESCRYTPEELATFVGEYLGPSLERAGLDTRIIAPEVINWGSLKPFGDALLNSTEALKYCDVIASHSYGDEPTGSRGYPYELVIEKGKELWETEYGFDQFAGDESMIPGIAIAKQMHGQIVNGPVSAYHTWWIIPADGVNGTASNGLVMRGHVIQRGYVMGNYSRFVRPGSYRIAATDNPSNGVYVTAYRNDSLGQLTIVVINENETAMEQSFSLNGISVPEIIPWETSDNLKLEACEPVSAGTGFLWTLPANSVVSFVGSYGSGYRLSVETIGLGTVNREPGGSNYEEGTVVTLTAQPENGWDFVGWSGEGISDSRNPLSITMDEDKMVSALFARSAVNGNLVLNGDFSSGSDEWTLNIWDGSASGNVIDQEYQIDIESIGTNDHDIQLVQSGLFLQTDSTYEITFDAYGEAERTLEFNVEMADDPWTSYLPQVQQFDLSATKQTFSFRFTMEHPTDINGRICFNTGASSETIIIDNVSVKLIDPTHASFQGKTEKVLRSNIKCKHSDLKVTFFSPGNQASLKLYNLNGKLLKTIALKTKAGEIYSQIHTLRNISNGYYLIKINSQKQTLFTSTIMVAK